MWNKERIIREMRSRGCRITEQRRILIEIILKNEYHCSKEIYYEALKQDSSIGMATVYRTINVLQDMGILKKECSMSTQTAGWDFDCDTKCRIAYSGGAQAEERDDTELYEQIKGFLQQRGYLRGKDFRAMILVDG